MREPLAAAAGIASSGGAEHLTVSTMESVGHRRAKLACCDCLAALCVLDFPSPDGWWDYVLRDAASSLRNLPSGVALATPKARLLWSLAPTKKTHEACPVLTQYFWQALLPELLTPRHPVTQCAAVARHAVEGLRFRPDTLVQACGSLLRAMRTDPSMLADGHGAAAADALRITRELLDAGVRKARDAAALASEAVAVALLVLRDYAKELSQAPQPGEITTFGGDSYSAERCCHAALESLTEAMSVSGASRALQDSQALCHIVAAAVECHEEAPDWSALVPDHGVVADSGASCRDAAAWTLRLLMRDPDDGGPSPPVPALRDAVCGILSGALADPKFAEAALFLSDAVLNEDNAAECSEGDALLSAVASHAVRGYGRQDAASPLEAFAGAVASRHARRLPQECHGALISGQWGAVVRGQRGSLAHSLAAAGLGWAVRDAYTVPAALRSASGFLEPSVEPLLQAACSEPGAAIEALEVIVQVLPDRVLAGDGAVKVVACIAQVVAGHHADTVVCSSALRSLSREFFQAVARCSPPAVVAAVPPAVGQLLRDVLANPAFGPLHGKACDALFAMCVGSGEAAVQAAALVLPAAATVDVTHEKLTLRAAARAVAVAAHLSSAGGALPAEASPALLEFTANTLQGSCQFDGIVAAAAGASALLLLPLMPQQALPRVAALSLHAASHAVARAKSFQFAPVLLPWLVYFCRDPVAALSEAGPAEQQQKVLSLWFTADAVFEPALRPVSAAAALAMLQDAQAGGPCTALLSAQVALTPIRACYERPKAAPVTTQVPVAAFAALLRLVDGSRCRAVVDTFASGPAAGRFVRLPLPERYPSAAHIEQHARDMLCALPPADAAVVRSLVDGLASPQPCSNSV